MSLFPTERQVFLLASPFSHGFPKRRASRACASWCYVVAVCFHGPQLIITKEKKRTYKKRSKAAFYCSDYCFYLHDSPVLLVPADCTLKHLNTELHTVWAPNFNTCDLNPAGTEKPPIFSSRNHFNTAPKRPQGSIHLDGYRVIEVFYRSKSLR